MGGDLRRYAAANARVRTLLPALLGRGGLEALATYPSADTMQDAILRTPYGEAVLPGLPYEVSLLHRLAAVGRALLPLVPDPERNVLRLYLLRHEVEGLKLVIRAVCRGLAWPAVTPYVVAWPDIATVDLKRLVEARDLREVVTRLEATPYGPPLRGALHRIEETGPFAAEVAVELDYYARLWGATATLRAADTARARRVLGILFDILNLGWIARYRDGWHLSPEEILNYTLPDGCWITPVIRRQLVEETDQPWATLLARTPYASPLAEVRPGGFDAAAGALWRFLASEVQRELAGYPFHIGVPLGFLLVQEIEIRDVRILLAARRLAVPMASVLDRLGSVRH
jgi:V/A-type H+-transporting ATPase subunit C